MLSRFAKVLMLLTAGLIPTFGWAQSESIDELYKKPSEKAACSIAIARWPRSTPK